MSRPPKWAKYFSLNDKPCRLEIEMGLSGYELVFYGDEGRLVLGKKHWHFDVEVLKKALDEGVAALKACDL